MRRINFIIVCFTVCLCLYSCKDELSNSTDKNSTSLIEAKQSVQLIPNYFALGFSIEESDSNCRVKILDVESGKEKQIVSCFNASRIVCLNSVFCGYLERLGRVDRIVAIDNGDFISNPALREKVQSGKIYQLAKGGELNFELCINSKPDLILTDHYDATDPVFSKLSAAGITILYCPDYLEKNPLGRAEWIRVIGRFCGAATESDSLFDLTRNRYDSIKSISKSQEKRPTVFSELNLSDAWYVPGGKSFVSQLITDAGGTYVFESIDKTGSVPLSFETVFSKAGEADIWINLHRAVSKDDLLKSDNRYAKFRAFSNGALYNNNARINMEGGNDFWESGLVNPDRILLDLAIIFHPEKFSSEQLFYYRKLKP